MFTTYLSGAICGILFNVLADKLLTDPEIGTYRALGFVVGLLGAALYKSLKQK